MYIDKLLQFSAAQAITATAVSTNVIDLLATANNIGVGDDLYIVITCDEAFTASGSATLTITLETDDNAAMSSSAVLWTSPAIGKASLTLAMAPIFVRLPVGNTIGGVPYERYLTLNYTVATGPMTAGKLTAGITHDIQLSKSYPGGFTSA
jgi:hypothetical protein